MTSISLPRQTTWKWPQWVGNLAQCLHLRRTARLGQTEDLALRRAMFTETMEQHPEAFQSELEFLFLMHQQTARY